MRLKVLAVNWHSGGAAGLYSGGGRRARIVLDGLGQRGHTVHIVDSRPSIGRGLDHLTSLREAPVWIRSSPADASLPERVLAILYSSSRLSAAACQQAIRLRPDLIYVPSAELHPALVAAILAGRLARIPVVACATTIVAWKTPPHYGLLDRFLRWQLTRINTTIVLSDRVKRTLINEGFKGRLVTGLTGVDRPQVSASGSGIDRLLFLSRLIPAKGLFDALRAFSLVHRVLPSSFLEVRGEGPARESHRMRIMAERLGLEGSLRLAGPIPTDLGKWRLLAESSAFVAPSYMEHFGLAVREALSAGVPTVAYALPAFEDLIGHPALTQVPIGNVEALSEALIAALCLTPDQRSAIQRTARSWKVGPEWAEAVDREEQILQEVASRNA